MPLASPPVDLIPKHPLVIGDKFLKDASGDRVANHATAPAGTAGVREFLQTKNVWIGLAASQGG